MSKTKQIYTKTVTLPERTFKIKTMLPWILFWILLMSAVICKQRFLHKNETVQYFQNYKYEDVNQGHFRKPPQDSTSVVKSDCPATAHTFFNGPFNVKLLFTFKLL